MKNYSITAIIVLFTTSFLQAQTSVPYSDLPRIPLPAMRGLALSADARHGAMGDAGVATSPDKGDMFWNPARTAFADTQYGLYSAYTPNVSRRFENGMQLIQVGAYYKLKDNKSAISISYVNFSEGLSQANNTGQLLSNYYSTDWLLGINFAKKISKKISLGIGIKYLNSRLYTEQNPPSSLGFNYQPASTLAADISIFHQGWDSTKRVNINYGVYISNLAGRVSYGGSESNFIPTNLKIGIAPTIKIAKNSTFTLAIDVNKLMIPTPTFSTTGRINQPTSAIGGILGSFSDAPDGLKEELEEITWSIGGEYWYKKTIALRMGKFIESGNKGGRNFTTFGVGAKIIKNINVDLAYMHNESENSFLGNMWRANVSFGIGEIKSSMN
ncbi:MAG: type IX secretion system outer membrane channel protein PorV [Bacteroidota bacterium]